MSIQIDRLAGLTEGVATKAPCRVATTEEISLLGLQTIDEVVLASGDRVLVKDQSNPVDNGVWIASSGAWSRGIDFNAQRDAVEGTTALIKSGALNGGKMFRVVGSDPIVVGVSGVTFETFLGNAANRDIGTSAGTIAAGDDARFFFKQAIDSPPAKPNLTKLRERWSTFDAMAQPLNEAVAAREVTSSDAGEISDAVQSIAAECATKQIALKAPAGLHYLDARIDTAAPLSLLGDGSGASELRWIDGATDGGGIKVVAGESAVRSVFRDLLLSTEGVDAGQALELDYTGTRDVTTLRFKSRIVVSGVEIKPAGTTAQYGFKSGLKLVNALYSFVSDFKFNGYLTSPSGPYSDGIGILLTGESGAGYGPVSAYLARLAIGTAGVGIQSENLEGVYIDTFDMVNVNKGIVVDNLVAEPGLIISKGHINSFDRGIDISNSIEFDISKVLFYLAASKPAAYTCVRIAGDQTKNGFIRENQFKWALTNYDSTAISVEKGLNVKIDSNQFDITSASASARTIDIAADAVNTDIAKQHVVNGLRTRNASTTTTLEEAWAYAGSLDDIAIQSRRGTQTHHLNTGATKLPAGVTALNAVVETISHNINSGVQMLRPASGSAIYRRSFASGVWSRWEDDLSGDLPSRAELNMFRRELRMELPFYVPALRTAVTTYSYDALYPQAATEDTVAKELFTLHVKVSAGDNAWSWVVVWDISNESAPAVKTTFAIKTTQWRESLIYRKIGSNRYLYLINDTTPVRIDITTLPADGAALDPTDSYTVGLAYSQMLWDGVRWVAQDPTVQNPGGVRVRHRWQGFSDDFSTVVANMTWPIWSVGSLNAYLDYLPKAQSVCWHNGRYYVACGTAYRPTQIPTPDPLQPSLQQGLISVTAGGDPDRVALCRPDVALTLMGTLTGRTLGVVEIESLWSDGDNLNALWQTLTPTEWAGSLGDQRGLVITRELSADYGAVDFASGSAVVRNPIDQRRTPVTRVGGQLANPVTGATLDSLAAILDHMVAAGIDEYKFYGTNQSITDINGAALPVTACDVTVKIIGNIRADITLKGLRSLRTYSVAPVVGTRVQSDGLLYRNASGDWSVGTDDSSPAVNSVAGARLNVDGTSSIYRAAGTPLSVGRGNDGYLLAGYRAGALGGGLFTTSRGGVDLRLTSTIWIGAGTGSPEGVITAPVSSMFTRGDGGANTVLYVKESGAGNTGWVAK